MDDDIVDDDENYPARALRALGLLLADGANTGGWGKTFWWVSRFFLRNEKSGGFCYETKSRKWIRGFDCFAEGYKRANAEI